MPSEILSLDATNEYALRAQMQQQEDAIDRQIADLNALFMDADPTGQEAIQGQINALIAQRLRLSAAYLRAADKLRHIDDLLARLEAITGTMKKEAARMQQVTDAVASAAKIVGLGKSVVDALDNAVKAVSGQNRPQAG
jgi:hypothetical protein